MQIRFLLGPAGSGKTRLCLEEVKRELIARPEGPPLILLAPRQATFQLESQLLADPALPGYTRLLIVSFQRLAEWLFAALDKPIPGLMSELGRIMVLRALLARHRPDLKLFQASSKLPGFARQLSLVLREIQSCGHSPKPLRELAGRLPGKSALGAKLIDLALVLELYFAWLNDRQVLDADCLLEMAADLVNLANLPRTAAGTAGENSPASQILTLPFQIGGLWLDGFADLTPRELQLLMVLLPYCHQVTLAFCLADIPQVEPHWLSIWSGLTRAFRKTYQRAKALAGATVEVQLLSREGPRTRFASNPWLAHLEKHWPAPVPFIADASQPRPAEVIKIFQCHAAENEAKVAAREVAQWVRQGGRYRDCAILLRQFEGYYDSLRRVFAGYDIPFFMDRRESVAHHPLAELSRYAVRIAAFGWPLADWIGALKTGLVPALESDVDRLENAALEHGWRGDTWLQPLALPRDPELVIKLEELRQSWVPPFLDFSRTLSGGPTVSSVVEFQQARPSGQQLAAALRELWKNLSVGECLLKWSQPPPGAEKHAGLDAQQSIHTTVWQQMHQMLDDLTMAFADIQLGLEEWLPILEAGLGSMTVGVIPPALDQVLIGTIDRSRNPDLQLAIVMGLNESIFPAMIAGGGILSDYDREILEAKGMELGPDRRAQIGQERYFAYIACTRPRERLVLTFAEVDQAGKPINPSPFIAHVQKLFPDLAVESPKALEQTEVMHGSELIEPLFKGDFAAWGEHELNRLLSSPSLQRLRGRLGRMTPPAMESISPAMVEALFTRTCRLPVTQLETFAACPCKFFVESGLRAQERALYLFDPRQMGSFMHEVLAEFHRQVRADNLQWRDVAPEQARQRVAAIGQHLATRFHEGLTQADAQNRLATRGMIGMLQDFIATLVGWMAYYRFDPWAAELSFGSGKTLPSWEIDLGNDFRLSIYGKIDRLDLWVDPDGRTHYVIMDYKSGAIKIDPVMMANGMQIQWPAYLCAFRHVAGSLPSSKPGQAMIPAGGFIVSLRGKYDAGSLRSDVLPQVETARQKAYQHQGHFDFARLRELDADPEAVTGRQFAYKLRNDGMPYARSAGPMFSDQFRAWLDEIEQTVARLGRGIVSGTVKLDPYYKGGETACDRCRYQPICRIDPWTHKYRKLVS